MPNGKLVTVIITTYKRPYMLKKAIKSVLSQTYKNWEMIVVDDNRPNSKDREATKNIMKEYYNNKKIKYLKHKCNKGYPAARNTGIKSAKGKYIALLDDDDIWLPEKLQLQLKKIDDEEVGLVYSRSLRIKRNGEIYKNVDENMLSGYVYEDILINNIPTSNVIIKKECFQKVGLYDERFPAKGDHDMFTRIAEKYKVAYVDKPLIKFRTHENRISRDVETKKKAWELFFKKRKNELSKNKYVKKKLKYKYNYSMGKIYYNNQEYKQAIKHFFNTIKINPRNYKALILLVLSILHIDIGLK